MPAVKPPTVLLMPVIGANPVPVATGNEPQFGIRPQYFYRKEAPETLRIIGLKASGVDEAVRRGELPPLLTLTPSGRSKGWRGCQLIAMIREQLEAANAPLPRVKRPLPPEFRRLLNLTAEDLERARRREDPELADAFETMMRHCVRARLAAGIKYAHGRPRLQLGVE
jgi:hypothetical protein